MFREGLCRNFQFGIFFDANVEVFTFDTSTIIFQKLIDDLAWNSKFGILFDANVAKSNFDTFYFFFLASLK